MLNKTENVRRVPIYCVLIIVYVIAMVFFLNSCATVEPWDKIVLSDPIMKFSIDGKNSAYEQHVLGTREASSGGYGGSGGGCGCK